MQAAGDLCGRRESLPLIAVVFQSLATPTRPLDLSRHSVSKAGPVTHVQTRDGLTLQHSQKEKKKDFQLFTYVRVQIASCVQQFATMRHT